MVYGKCLQGSQFEASAEWVSLVWVDADVVGRPAKT
jgi:hypothetical protein